MSFKHSAFIFDYRNFRISTSSIIDSLDMGNEIPLKERAYHIKNTIEEKDWILANCGTSIGNLGWDKDPASRHGLWGHWLLIILSQFLLPCVSLEYGWTELSSLLHTQKWVDENIWKLLTGLPVAQIIKPHEQYRRDIPIRWSDPYWAWIRPERSRYSGWLPQAEINKMSTELAQIDSKANKDKNKFLTLARAMIEKAKQTNLGLYMVIYQPDDLMDSGINYEKIES